jgi:membrane associated rhomboid family serine protease
MTFLNHLEKRFGFLAVPGIIRYVVLLNALVFALQLVAPGYENFLALDRAAVFSGEVWRLFTWIFIPSTTSPFWVLFFLLFLWFMGDMLEASWTPFRTTLFYISGWFFCTVAAVLLPGANIGPGANFFLNLSLLFAVATLQPNYQILFFFLIPMKLRTLGWISLILPGLMFATASPAGKAAIVISLANYALFFGPAFLRERAQRASNSMRLAKFDKARDLSEPMHRCEVCGRTELTDPDLEFRVTADGREFCMDHLPSRTKNS